MASSQGAEASEEYDSARDIHEMFREIRIDGWLKPAFLSFGVKLRIVSANQETGLVRQWPGLLAMVSNKGTRRGRNRDCASTFARDREMPCISRTREEKRSGPLNSALVSSRTRWAKSQEGVENHRVAVV